MKTFILLMACFACSLNSFSQDIIYHNDFNDTRDWNASTSNVFVTKVLSTSGKLILNPDAVDEWFEKTIDVEINYRRNFRIETSMAVTSEEANNTWYGLQFGSKGVHCNQFLIITGSSQGEFVYRSYTEAKEYVRHIDYTKHPAIKNERFEYNKITIEKIGSELIFYINDRRVSSYPVQTFYGNELGFKLSRQKSLAVDYLTVSYIDGKQKLNNDNIKVPVDDLIKTAIKLKNEKKFEEALDYCESALKKDPKNSWALNIKGLIYYERKEIQASIHIFSEAILSDPEYKQVFANRGDAYYDLKKYDEAIADYSEAIRLDKTYSYAWFSRGYAYKGKEAWEQALADFNEAIKIDNKYVGAYRARGDVYYNMKKYEKALQSYEEATRLDPTNVSGWYGKGNAYGDMGNLTNAIKCFSEALSIDPEHISSLNNRGLAYVDNGEYTKAIEDYKKLLRLDPEYRRAYINIIGPLVRTLQFEAAKYYYDEYKSKGLKTYVDTNEKWAFYNYFITAVTRNIPESSYREALTNLNTALRMYGTQVLEENKSEYINILVLKGYTLEQMGLLSEAKDAYNQALAVRANQDDVRKALARITKTETIANNTDNIPPVIELISPSPSRGLDIVPKTETQVIGRAKDASGIATLKINGKAIKAEEDGLFVTSMELRNGVNDIIITATDNRGNTSSKTFSIAGKVLVNIEEPAIQVVANTGTSAPEFHAIIIAAEDYADPSITDLENPVSDATELKNILTTHYTFSAKNIQTLFNKSRDEIMQAVVQTSNSLGENDNLLIFYAGHGIAEKDKFGDVDGYWIPASAKKGLTSTYISADDIKKALKRSDARHILVVADACFSGAFTRELSSDASVGVQKQYSVPSRKVMASGNMEPVPDNSRFIFYLKKHLKENKQKYLTAKKLFDGFYEAILNNSDTSPQYAAIKNVGDEGGEFVFIKK